jgi:putative endonuclease
MGAVTAHAGAMTLVRRAFGAWGERRAAQHLVEAGLQVVARNWRCPAGEIDIVAWEGDVLVVCEVKTRRGPEFGPPAGAVVHAKARRLRRLAALWLAESGARAAEVRFDVVSVLAPRTGVVEVEHVRGAF